MPGIDDHLFQLIISKIESTAVEQRGRVDEIRKLLTDTLAEFKTEITTLKGRVENVERNQDRIWAYIVVVGSVVSFVAKYLLDWLSQFLPHVGK